MQTLECQVPSILFLNKREEDTTFLTRDLPMGVVRTEDLNEAQRELENEQIKGIFIDVASAEPSDILSLRRNSSRRDIPIFILASPEELPLAIEYVKLGAQGFLIKGLSDSDSILKLMQYATTQY